MIAGNGGDDTFYGGPGNDRVQGGEGDDMIFVGGTVDFMANTAQGGPGKTR